MFFLKHFFEKFLVFFRSQKNKWSFWPFVLIFFLLLSVGIGIVFFPHGILFSTKIQKIENNDSALASQQEAIKEEFLPRFLDGVLVKKGQEALRPIAVMIDNLPIARPQAGISQASLVIEAPVEAGITRFLAFFQNDEKVEDIEVGPIRSIRPYFVDFAEEVKALVAHVGGSPQGLKDIQRAKEIIDADDIGGRNYFFRIKERFAPHNMYGSIQALRQYLSSSGYDQNVNFEMWSYRDFPNDIDIENREIFEPYIIFLSGNNEVLWKYDLKIHSYVRYRKTPLGDDDWVKDWDQNDKEIQAKNVVLVSMKMWILDEVGRRAFETIGQGKAQIFSGGENFSEVIWKKPTKESRIKFYGLDGKEIAFLRGTTWIEIIPNWGVEHGVLRKNDF